jgi:tetratricopeptide (TPR) repeat protein
VKRGIEEGFTTEHTERTEEGKQSGVATRQAEMAQAVTSFLRRMLSGVSPEVARTKDRALLASMLSDAAKEADAEKDPQVQGVIRATIGRLKKYDRAQALYERLLEAQPRVLGEKSEKYFGTLHNYAALCRDQGRFLDAEAASAKAVAGARENLPPGHYYIPAFMIGHALALIGLEQYDHAETELLEAHGLVEHSTSMPASLRTKNEATLAQLYEKWGKPDQAAKWRAAAAPAPASGSR